MGEDTIHFTEGASRTTGRRRRRSFRRREQMIVLSALPALFVVLVLSVQVIAYKPNTAESRSIQAVALEKMRQQGKGYTHPQPKPAPFALAKPFDQRRPFSGDQVEEHLVMGDSGFTGFVTD